MRVRRDVRTFLAWLVLIAVSVVIGEIAFADRTRIVRFQDSVSYLADQGYDAGYDAGYDGGYDAGYDGGYDAGLNASFSMVNQENDYVTCSDRAGFTPGASLSTFSVCAWIRPTSLGVGDQSFIASQWGSSDNSWWFSIQNAGYLRFTVANSGTDSSNYVNWTSYQLSVNTWAYVCATYNAGAVTVYENGNTHSLGTSGSIASTLRNSANALEIGNFSGSLNDVYAFPGQIGPVYIWTVTLSGGQITTQYNSGTPLPYASVSPTPSFAIFGCTHQGSGGPPNYADETGGADCVATNGPTCVSTWPP